MTNTTTFKNNNADTIAKIFQNMISIANTRSPRGMNSLIDDAIAHFIYEHPDNCDCPNPNNCPFDNQEFIDTLFAEVQLYIVNMTGTYRAPSDEVLESILDMILAARNLTLGIRYARDEHLIAIPDHADVKIEFGHQCGADFTIVLSGIEPGGFTTLDRVHTVLGELLTDSTWCEYTHATIAGSLIVQ